MAHDFETNLTSREYSALMDIFGLDPKAHMLVMTAECQNGGAYLLRGSHDAFDALLRDIDEEIEECMAPKKNLPALRRIQGYLTPESEDESDV